MHMASKRPKPQGEEPRSEPEIIPPDHAERGTPRMHVFIDSQGTERVYIAKPMSLGTILMILITGLLLAVFLVLLLGALLIWLPAVILLVTAVVVVRLLRMYFQGAP